MLIDATCRKAHGCWENAYTCIFSAFVAKYTSVCAFCLSEIKYIHKKFFWEKGELTCQIVMTSIMTEMTEMTEDHPEMTDIMMIMMTDP